MLSEHDGFEKMMINSLLGINSRETQNSILDVRSITDHFYSSGNRDPLLYHYNTVTLDNIFILDYILTIVGIIVIKELKVGKEIVQKNRTTIEQNIT